MAKPEQIEKDRRWRIHESVSAQFGAAAAAYTTSPVHADPDALRQVVELAKPQPTDRALDIATGAGHTALALASHVAEVVAYDMTQPMLLETARNAAARGMLHCAWQWQSFQTRSKNAFALESTSSVTISAGTL